MSDFGQYLTSRLEQIEAAGLRRTLREIDSAQGAEVTCEGRALVNFSSNDYLGLANHPRLAEAAREALDCAGAGVGASRLISGNHRLHDELEQELARFKNTPAALTFSSGYAAALGTIPAVTGQGDVVILDKLCHASLIDGARLSGATLRVFPHNHLEKLESHLRWAREKYPQARVLVVVESIYSMDGDLAPLSEIVALKEQYGAWLFVDEAHAVGVRGAQGRGLADEYGVADRIEMQMGTLGKSLGASGAYICGSESLRDYLINSARSFIFSTAPPPAVAASAKAAVALLASEEGARLMARLDEVRALSARAFGSTAADSAIFPIMIGDEREAVAAARRLWEAGFFVPAVRFPTVAKGTARLRATVTAAHTGEQLAALGAALREQTA